MNCQEVMEFMQRQLDGDLDAKEEDELHAHLMHCLDCAQMFERLQRLSDELTQLPKGHSSIQFGRCYHAAAS